MSDVKNKAFLIKDIDETSWRNFKSRVLLEGHDSINKLFKNFIDTYTVRSSEYEKILK
tara:strand:+ start:926 stop:1099 length:174 start_codon:yes stop_codon:yes gene_type:complete